MVVTVNGEARYSWPISSGVAQFPTPTGTFRPQWTAKMWYSRKYDMSPMPHSVFINGGVAVHGTYHVRSLGSAASHGCIRLSTSNAKTFYNLVQKHGLSRTKVSVFGRPHWRGPAMANRDRRGQQEYADNQNSWSWGDSWGGNSDWPMHPRSRRNIAKASTIMTPMACAGRSGEAAITPTLRRQLRRDYNRYGYAYGGPSQDW